MFLVLIIQIINLQLIHGSEYKQKSKSNMENYIPIPASRGQIYDRNYSNDNKKVVLVSNRPSFNITLVAAKFKTKKKLHEVIENLSNLLKVPISEIKKEIKAKNPWERIIIKEDVGFDIIVKIASRQDKFFHVDWEDAPVRVYNFSNMFAHSVGYIGSISKREYKKLKSSGYKHYQKIGKSGVEKQYDKLLKGKDGFVRRIVDVRNRTEGEEIGLHPTGGNDVVLTLDYEVQKAAYDAIGDAIGAIIVVKPSTGEVISLVSKPDFDPNELISKNNYNAIKELQANKNKPFINRVIQSKYPPASTFKIVTALAGMETEKTYPSKTFYCPGKYTLRGLKDRDFYCYETHRTLDLYWAIARSCSVYFYQLGYKIGPTVILTYANHFGLSEITGIDIPGEVPGHVPSKKWKLKNFGQPWFDGDTLNLSIGQGFLNVTTLGMVNFISAVVNNGIVYKPHLLKEIWSSGNSMKVKKINKIKVREIPLSPVSLKTVKYGMRLGVTSGTSYGLSRLKVPVAGKTGTAQTR